MSSDDISTTNVTLAKRPASRKNRSLSNNQSTKDNLADNPRVNRTMTAASNRSSSKLPNLLVKDNIYGSRPETMQYKRYRSQEKDLTTSSSKFDRQSTVINIQTRLPTLYSLTHDQDNKRISEIRRRQIYALNHLMRELEQDQFRQFCKLRGIGTDNRERTVISNEGTNKEPST